MLGSQWCENQGPSAIWANECVASQNPLGASTPQSHEWDYSLCQRLSMNRQTFYTNLVSAVANTSIPFVEGGL